MYSIRGVKKNGTYHNYETKGYTVDPRGSVPCVTLNDGGVTMYVSDHDAHYESIFVMNSSGVTIDTLRASRRGK